MRFDVVTLFPRQFEILSAAEGVIARALARGLAQLHLWNPRDFTADRHQRVDDRPYGGGPGMVLQVAPVRAALQAARAAAPASQVIYLSPQGRVLNQTAVRTLASASGWILLAGRYEGIDERLLRDVDVEYSIGDYVLSGGELPAMVLMDAVIRLLPGALGHAESAQQDSHVAPLLDYPHYSRPVEYDGQQVPAVLLSGDHVAIARWRRQQALGRTWLRRPDLLAQWPLTVEERTLLNEFLTVRHETAATFGE